MQPLTGIFVTRAKVEHAQAVHAEAVANYRQSVLASVKDVETALGTIHYRRQQATAQDGDIVVALVDDEATIKRFVKAPGYVLLKPDSSRPGYHPIMVTNGFRVLGTAIRVLKKGSELITTVEE